MNRVHIDFGVSSFGDPYDFGAGIFENYLTGSMI